MTPEVAEILVRGLQYIGAGLAMVGTLGAASSSHLSTSQIPIPHDGSRGHLPGAEKRWAIFLGAIIPLEHRHERRAAQEC